MSLIKINNEKAKNLKNQQARTLRAEALRIEADPLFFKVQRGEATIDQWQAKVEEIRQRHPYVD